MFLPKNKIKINNVTLLDNWIQIMCTENIIFKENKDKFQYIKF